MGLKIKDWSKFQHFKDRTPPWVKLYRDILDDPDWHELDGDCAKTLTMLWLIASEDDSHQGVLPEARKLAFRLRISENKLNQQLIKLSHWLVQDDINVISERYQSDAPERAGEETETETETYKPETETEKEKRAPRFDAQAHLVSLGIDDVLATEWIALKKRNKSNPTELIIKGIIREAAAARITLSDAMTMQVENGWKGFKAEYVQNKKINGSHYQSAKQATDSAQLRAIGWTPEMTQAIKDKQQGILIEGTAL